MVFGKILSIAVDTGISASVIAILVFGISMSQKAGEAESRNISSMASMKEYREWNRWDNKVVYSSDILSAIMKYKGDPVVQINEPVDDKTSYGNPISQYISADTDTDSDSFSAPKSTIVRQEHLSSIYSDFSSETSRYIAHIEKDPNGTVICIHFTKVGD